MNQNDGILTIDTAAEVPLVVTPKKKKFVPRGTRGNLALSDRHTEVAVARAQRWFRNNDVDRVTPGHIQNKIVIYGIKLGNLKNADNVVS